MSLVAASILGAASGLLLFLAFPPVDLGPVAFVALIPIVHAFYSSRPRVFLAAAASFGVSFFGPLLYWIALFGPEAYLALVFLQVAMVAGVLVPGSWIASRLRGAARLAVFPASWVCAEYLRGSWPFGGFTWGGVGYSQHDNATLLRLVSFTGVWGIGATVALGAVFLWRSVGSGRLSSRALWALAGFLVVLFPVVLSPASPGRGSVGVAIVQGSAPENTLDPRADDFDVLESHVQLTGALPTNVDLVVWPESALDTDPGRDQEFGRIVSEAVIDRSAHFAIGAYREVPPDRFLNSTLFYGPGGSVLQIYDKQHLVPFGEYMPFREFLQPILGPVIEQLALLPRDGVPGAEMVVFDLPQGRFATPICFESTFPAIVRDAVNGGAQFLVISTNNSSYARTAASAQHLAFAQVRAAEHHTWVLQAALSGISATIDHEGRIRQRTGLFSKDVLIENVALSTGRTFYAKAGDWLPLGSLVWLGVVALTMTLGRFSRVRPRRLGRMAAPRPLIVIPTYNEADNITGIVNAVLNSVDGADVLVVDDGSPDGTGSLVAALARSEQRVHLLERAEKLGLGRAYVDGFRWGLERGHNVFVEMDADFSHDPADLPRLLEELDSSGSGLVIGSRYVAQGGVEGWSRFRHALSKSGNLYARAALGFSVRDATSGFRCYRREVLDEIDLASVRSEGYAFQVDMAYRVWQLGFHIVEVPIIFRERREGMSKMSRGIVSEALVSVTVWGLRDVLLGKRFRLR